MEVHIDDSAGGLIDRMAHSSVTIDQSGVPPIVERILGITPVCAAQAHNAL
jgi:hypothetical protein